MTAGERDLGGNRSSGNRFSGHGVGGGAGWQSPGSGVGAGPDSPGSTFGATGPVGSGGCGGEGRRWRSDWTGPSPASAGADRADGGLAALAIVDEVQAPEAVRMV
ncbi:hypothetical protein [Actinosynnema pretiosum]|uniref:Uncharacterized protein n=1 Tax=Actinosynnema pretiosum TaxID=42197 RepID=A0A290Z807_9PSEU|nr:hypothetical protein [Actinosynnema pretiosum]ATE55150.1 hypothetical protein CNX65_19190 [Actinosynnema pretiosum]